MSSEIEIKFGTSGYRGIIGRSFSCKHVRAIARAIAQYLKHSGHEHPYIIIGYDPRTGNDPQLSEGSYTHTLVQTLSYLGVSVDICQSYTPTPLISWAIEHRSYQGGIILTASHNPPNYNGIKFNPNDGAPASIEVSTQIGTDASSYLKEEVYGDTPSIPEDAPATAKAASLGKAFANSLHKTCAQLLNTELPDLDLPIVIDAKHGATASTWQTLMHRFGMSQSTVLHSEPLPDFGKLAPNPLDLNGLYDLKAAMITQSAVMGIANDPDGDRHIILDENGDALSPEETAVIITDYLHANGVQLAGLASTCASSYLVAAAATTMDIPYLETAVGFKYFTQPFKRARRQQKILVAVESSGGISASCHTLEKCGFFPGLLLGLIAKIQNKKISELRDAIRARYGSYTFIEDAVSYNPAARTAIQTLVNESSIETLQEKIGLLISRLSRKDGLKLYFEGNDWVLLRLSGTEPVLRIYAESQNSQRSQELITQSRGLIADFA